MSANEEQKIRGSKGETGSTFADISNIHEVDQILSKLSLSIYTSEDDLKRIPRDQSFVVVSNRLLAPIDAAIITRILSGKVLDVEIVEDEKFDYDKSLEPIVTTIDPDAVENSPHQLRQLIETDNTALIIFPGPQGKFIKVSDRRFRENRWNSSVVRLIRELDLPVLPISISSDEQFVFKVLRYNKLSRNLKQVFGSSGDSSKVIHARIGKLIPAARLKDFTETKLLARFLRTKTYSLSSPAKVRKWFDPGLLKRTTQQELIDPVDPELQRKEMSQLCDQIIASQGNFDIYSASAYQIPNTLREIGRLREKTFRAVDEGTSNPLDLDEYDVYYRQLIMWDREAGCVVGGYRMGLGDYIYNSYGLDGFYIRSLFKIQPGFGHIMSQSVELGRSYIVPEYQRQRLPLFLLWKGILYFLLKNPQYRYLIGPMSISKHYSDISKHLIVEFIKRHFYDGYLASYIRPKKKFRFRQKEFDTEILLQNFDGQLKNLDNFIEDVEPSHFRLPVLLKKYMMLNAKIIGFNLDPQFSDVLDGLMILDMKDVPEDIIESLKKEV